MSNYIAMREIYQGAPIIMVCKEKSERGGAYLVFKETDLSVAAK